MTTYADPTRCPDCRALLPQQPRTCPTCGLALTGPTAAELFTTFQRADALLAVLRQTRVLVPAGAPAPSSPAAPELPAFPAQGRATAPAARVRTASVPQVLLSLGALCLLVAAITFLAVAWSWLGVSGRTLVLVALTGTALALGQVLLRRGLRTAAEALSVVGLGLLALDVVGARHSGWLGDLSDSRAVTVTAGVVALAALGLVLLGRPRPMVAPAVIAPLATLVAGVATLARPESAWPLALDIVVLLGLGHAGRTLGSRALTVTALVCAVPAWLLLITRSLGLAHVADGFTVAQLWGSGAGPLLVVAVALAAASGPAVGLGRVPSLGGYGVAGLLGGYVAALPALDNGLTPATSALLVVAAAWVLVVAVAPTGWRAVGVLPLAGSAVVPAATVVSLAASALTAVLSVGPPFSRPAGVHVEAGSLPAAPWLLVPCVVVLVAGACALATWALEARRSSCAAGLAGAALLGVVLTLPLYDVPLALVVGLLALAGAAAFLGADRLDDEPATVLRAAGLVLLALAVVAALPSDVLATAALTVASVVTALLVRRTDLTGEAAALLLPLALGGLVWSAGEVAGVPEVQRAVPAMLLVGGLALWRPRITSEVGAALAGAVAGAGSVLAADDGQWALAVHLTVAGVLVTATALVHPSRRTLAWPGGLLLAAATWVRLVQLGVHAPEAYTLPSTLILVALGVWRLRHDERATSLAVLAPGLTLATVPSLLASLDDPVSLRALLLGAACLALVLAGVALRTGAPLVIGAGVGTVLVLRVLAPYAAVVPTWLVIGLSGVLLTVVGITWESRLRDVRRATGYVGSLR